MKMRNMAVKAVLICALVLSFSLKSYSREPRDCSAPVKTAEGLVKGMADPEAEACAWKGIPYAAAPVGDLRFRETQPALARTGTLEADQVGMSCPQVEHFTSGGKSRGFSEDCLNLNIWSPKPAGQFPVMVWFHGGGFQQGGGGYDMYRGSFLAGEKNVVIVTINYRLGSLGFLALPELKSEDPNGSAGNYGILDQVQALKWVRDNIAGFGGDPANVTIFGQSAGAMSVCAHLVSPLSQGLFQRAVVISGPCDMFFTLDQGYEQGKSLLKTVGCPEQGPDAVKCLRAKTPAEIYIKSPNRLFALGMTCAPHIDGYVIPDQPIKLIQQGKYNRAPLMIGNMKEELKLYTMMISGIGLVPPALITALMRKLMGDKTDEILALYSYKDYRRPADLFIATGNDLVFGSAAFQMAEAMSKNNPVYLYRVDWNDTNFPHKMGSFHGMDVPLVFGTLNTNTAMVNIMANKKAKERAKPLSDQVMSYYTNFARTGNPNGENLLLWPAYDPKNKSRIIFNNPVTISPLSDQEVKRFQYFQQNPPSQIVPKGKNQ